VSPVQFLPQCDNMAIMNEGDMVYFGPWNEEAKRLLNQYLPVSHLLAAGGAAEQPKGDKKKVAPKRKASTRQPSFKKKEPKVQPPAIAKRKFDLFWVEPFCKYCFYAVDYGAVLTQSSRN
jgi:ATP-binding cassette, subfamily C (CFTR/MRP), member 1